MADVTQKGSSPHVRESGFCNSGNFCLWNLESWVLEFGIHLKESGIPLTIGIQNPSSTDKESGIQYLESGTAGNPESKTGLDSLTWGEYTRL